MEVQDLIENVQDLSDVELAVLLCLIAQEHCLFETADELVDDLASELALVVSEGFGLSYTVLSSDDLGSIDGFGDAILDESTEEHEGSEGDGSFSGHHSRLADVRVRAGHLAQEEPKLDTRKIVNVVIAKDFNLASKDVQTQAVELIRRRRVYSRTTIHTCPDPFLFLPIVSASSKHVRLNKHLIDRIFISHVHYVDDGFPNLEEIEDIANSDDQASTSSIVRRLNSNTVDTISNPRRIDMKVIDQLRHLGDSAHMTVEVRRYLSNLVVFMRYERGVAGGISPHATILFEKLSKLLAPLHSLNFVTPSLVALAAKKIYPHRILIASPERERSVLFGSKVEVIRAVLKDISPETVVDAVLARVECPL